MILLPSLDFETYSEAGYYFDPIVKRWKSVSGQKGGITAVGAAVYSEHPTTEVLCLAYDLKDGRGGQLWVPGMQPPMELFAHIAAGGLLAAWNSSFEYYIWKNVCTARMGWPPLPLTLLRDTMARSRAHSLPGKLEKAAKALEVIDQKIGDGARLIKKFSVPKSPSQKDPRQRIRPEGEPLDAANLYTYCLGDIKAEEAVGACTPELDPEELDLWLLDQEVNTRGIAIDLEAVAACKSIVEQATVQYGAELAAITGGAVESATQLPKIKDWLVTQGVVVETLDKAAIVEILKRPDLPPAARRVLEIRQSLGASSVKKLYALDRRVSGDGRLRDMFAFCGADRTGRWAGRGPQPQNLPNSGPPVFLCSCGRHSGGHLYYCPWCGSPASTPREWGIGAVEDALLIIARGSLREVEHFFGDAVATVSGCLRGLFRAAPGHDLICSDFSAIEAVVLAILAGEEWRVEVFRTHGMIYEESASRITGIPLEDFIAYRKANGEHHPARKKVGKVAELASGYQGWVVAWKAFGAEKHIGNDDEIAEAVRAWRKASPAIAGTYPYDTTPGIWRGLEKAAVSAVQNPGQCYAYRGISYGVRDDILYCLLPSGRKLTYHQPRLTPGESYGKPTINLTYMGWNGNHEKGPVGWLRLETYGGKLTENVVQAVARDILAHALKNVERAGYPVVMHVHDEIISEVPTGTGATEEFETIMATLPAWAADWPIKAAGGWRGQRYRKE